MKKSAPLTRPKSFATTSVIISWRCRSLQLQRVKWQSAGVGA
jgi:hypothetical protein